MNLKIYFESTVWKCIIESLTNCKSNFEKNLGKVCKSDMKYIIIDIKCAVSKPNWSHVLFRAHVPFRAHVLFRAHLLFRAICQCFFFLFQIQSTNILKVNSVQLNSNKILSSPCRERGSKRPNIKNGSPKPNRGWRLGTTGLCCILDSHWFVPVG